MSYKFYLYHACRLQDIEDEATLTAECESDSDDEMMRYSWMIMMHTLHL